MPKPHVLVIFTTVSVLGDALVGEPPRDTYSVRCFALEETDDEVNDLCSHVPGYGSSLESTDKARELLVATIKLLLSKGYNSTTKEQTITI